MALPIMSVPEFSTKLPSTGKEIRYRPFLVKEEKVLLMALQGEDQTEITTAITNLLESCIVSKGVRIDKLSTFDIEYLFLKIRAKSVGEIVEMVMSHPEGDCKEKTTVSVNLDEIKIDKKPNNDKIMLDEEIGVKMRYPSIKDIVDFDINNPDSIFGMMASCVEYAFDSNQVYNEFSHEEMVAWIGSLNQSQFNNIYSFFQDAPKLTHEIKWTCSACGKEEKIVLQGLQDFFTYQ
jgi:hypothetical protein